ncbi:hypothetical protein [Lactococcus lactis]|uniref:Molecular chaperone, HSP90 family n=1 Tax=Lactococcus lactis subsp. lactis TaxID=1360 RepID=A0A2N5WD50_LACLL|nr:hypothetical protein [Lactococcus lactis]MBU5242048.1 hypothetical protein [Lactococcus lactis]MDT2856209.1 hypothetical protein [Lactococcus lactis]PLW60156.1 hypothetical protein CYU10_001109 [Lactococcus lactis subsp. lactis]
MTQKLHPWENPEQDYARNLAKRRSERRYRSLQLVKTLKILLTEFKKYDVNNFNSEILSWIDLLEDAVEYVDDEDFKSAKKFVSRMQRELKKLEK